MRYHGVGEQAPPANNKKTRIMKLHYATLALAAGVSVAFSSCVAPYAGYVSYSAPAGISTGVAWTNASYDADGFPIFGYSYGRPVYGYTAAGAAIFTIGALTALCYVPHWGPASWYHGHFHYPHGIHRVPQPPRFPAGHAPHVRPPAGAHTGPGMPRPGAAPRPAAPQPGWHRPGSNVGPQRPGWSQPARPNHQGQLRPGSVQARPAQPNRHQGQLRPGSAQGLPGAQHAARAPRSAQAGKPAAGRGGATTLPAVQPGRPVSAPGSFAAGRGGFGRSGSGLGMAAPRAAAGGFRAGAPRGGRR